MRRVKIERAKQLLADTDGLMPRIANQCEFERAEVFFRAFRRQVGVSPSVFRKRARH